MSIAAHLRGGRDAAASGRLSLDREKAREKMRMFRLPDPHFYVLQFVRAASVLNATKVEFEISATELTCRFDRDLPAELLKDIWNAAFEARGDAHTQALHYIALGLGSAQALDPKFIDISTGTASLQLRGEEEAISVLDVPVVGTVIHVREKLRFGHLLDFFSSVNGGYAEAEALKRSAFARMTILVNGVALGVDTRKWHAFPVEFSCALGSGQVGLRPNSTDGEDGWCAILCDSVTVARQFVSNHGLAGVGVMESRQLRTDLSGLALIDGTEVLDALHGAFIPAYHKALDGWLRSDQADDADKLDAAARLIRYVTLLQRQKRPVDDVTRSLVDWLTREPLFEDATRHARLSLLDAASGNAFLISRERVLGVLLPTGERVLLVEYAGSTPAPRRRERLLREELIKALDESNLGIVKGVTLWLKRRREAQRNQQLWMSRPADGIAECALQRVVSIDGARGQVCIPTQSGRSTSPIVVVECGLFIYADSRLIRYARDTEMFGVSIDADFTPVETFDDVVRDERFDRLAVELCLAMCDLFGDFADSLVTMGAVEASEPAVLDSFVMRLCHGTFCESFMASLGYGRSDTLDVLLMRPELASLKWFSSPQPLDEFITKLGPIAQVRSYALADGGRASLAELATRGDLMLLSGSGTWRGFLAHTCNVLGPEVLASIVIVDYFQEKILRFIHPTCPDAVLAVPRMQAQRRFLAGPKFFDPTPRDAIAATRSVDTDVGHIKVMLVPTAEVDTCDVYFLSHGRRLARRTFDMVGSFRAVISSDELASTDNFDDVLEDHVYATLVARLRSEASPLLADWWHQRAAAADIGSGDVLRLFVRVALTFAKDDPDAVVLPVLTLELDEWLLSFVSWNELRAQAVKQGFVLHFTELGAPGAASPAMVLRLAPKIGPDALRALCGAEFRLVDTDTVDAAVGLVGRETFLAKKLYAGPATGGVANWEGTIRELDCRVAMFADPSVGTGRQRNLVAVLFEGRLLEKLDVETPMGQFRSVVSGAGISPDPTYKFAAAGRAEVLHAVYEAAATTIREACRTVTAAAGAGAVADGLAHELRRSLAICRTKEPKPPFDLGALLESTPLFELLDGTYLSFRQLPDIAREGVVRYSDYGEAADTLWLTPGDVPVVEAVFARELRLEPTEREIESHSEALIHAELRANTGDPLLDDVVHILLDARGSRRDLFDDYFAHAFVWSELPSEMLCRVTHEQVEIDERHALVQRVRASDDHISRVFLASTVYSAINAYYQRITDHDELELQARLVRGMRV